MPVKHPKSAKQIRDHQFNERKKRLINHDDLYGAFEIAHTLQGFVVDLKLFPYFSVIFGIPQLLQEVKQFCNDEGFYFCYDTTFNCGDFYVSTLLFRHIRFAENPIIPLFVMIHDQKVEVVHANFFKIAASKLQASKSDIILITDREAAIEKAAEKECPTWKRYNCWNHLLNDIKFWLRRHGGKNDDILVYRSNILSLLKCASLEKFEELEQNSCKKWSKGFVEYYKNHLRKSIIKKCGRWLLEEAKIYTSNSGITTNPAESFNAQLKRSLGNSETKVHAFLLAVYFLQNFEYREILRGYCGMGDWNLANLKLTRNIEDVDFPHDVIKPDEIAVIIKNKEIRADQTQMEQNNTVQGLANYLRSENRINLNAAMQCFVVKGLNDKIFTVKLYPEQCSCGASRRCCHIEACCLAVGKKTGKEKRKFSLSVLKRNARGKNKSGRKFPGRIKHENVLAASDSAEKDERYLPGFSSKRPRFSTRSKVLPSNDIQTPVKKFAAHIKRPNKFKDGKFFIDLTGICT